MVNPMRFPKAPLALWPPPLRQQNLEQRRRIPAPPDPGARQPMATPDPQQHAKRLAGELAASLVMPGMRVGLGTGSTASEAVRALGERIAEDTDLKVEAVCSSERTRQLAEQYGIPVVPLDGHPLDIYMDGADQIDREGRLIKGGGGALLREKLVAASARHRVILVDTSKLARRLGRGFPVPVEVVAFGLDATRQRIEALGGHAVLRTGPDGRAFLTDERHHILDVIYADGIDQPAHLGSQLKALVGVVETGIFTGMTDAVILADAKGAAMHSALDWPAAFDRHTQR